MKLFTLYVDDDNYAVFQTTNREKASSLISELLDKTQRIIAMYQPDMLLKNAYFQAKQKLYRLQELQKELKYDTVIVDVQGESLLLQKDIDAQEVLIEDLKWRIDENKSEFDRYRNKHWLSFHIWYDEEEGIRTREEVKDMLECQIHESRLDEILPCIY
jgi:predicted secreted acid phosphatase